MAFISCRNRLTKVLVFATREEKGTKDGGGQMRLPDIDTGGLSGLKYKLVCHFKLATDVVVVSGSLK